MAKRLLFFSRVNVIVFVLALVAIVHRMDSSELGQSVRALDLIKSTIVTTEFDRSLHDGRFHKAALDWINNTDPELERQHVAVRSQLTEMLQRSGFTDQNLAAVKGREAVDAPSAFSLIEIEQIDEIDDSVLNFSEQSINEAIRLFDEYASPRILDVAVGMEESALSSFATDPTVASGFPAPPDPPSLSQPYAGENSDEEFLALSQSDELPPIAPVPDFAAPPLPGGDLALLEPPSLADPWGTSSMPVTSVALHDGIIVIDMRDLQINSPTQMPMEFLSRQEMIAAETVSVLGPSLYQLQTATAADPEVETLYNNRDVLDRLLTAYGGLKFGLAEQVLAEEYVRTYQSVDVFGFSISTRRYPFAILALMLVSTWVIAWTVETARQSKRRILSDVHDVDVVDSLLDFQLMRIALWVVLPVISVWAALPLFPLNQTEQIIIVGGVGLVVIMGIVATVRARSL